MKCTNCKKEVDTSKIYFTLCEEVGDRSNKSITESQLKKWDALEEKREKAFCYECGSILEKSQNDKKEAQKIIYKFFKLLDK